MMNALEWYFKIDQKYHEEVYDLLQVLENDLMDEQAEKAQETALKRLNELVAITSIPK